MVARVLLSGWWLLYSCEGVSMCSLGSVYRVF